MRKENRKEFFWFVCKNTVYSIWLLISSLSKKTHSQTVIYITISHETLLQLFIGEFHAPRWSSAVNPHHPDTLTHLPLSLRSNYLNSQKYKMIILHPKPAPHLHLCQVMRTAFCFGTSYFYILLITLSAHPQMNSAWEHPEIYN